MKLVIGFDNGVCGLLKMLLPVEYQVYHFSENLALGDISCDGNRLDERESIRKIMLFEHSDDPDAIKNFFRESDELLDLLNGDDKSISEITLWGELSSPNICNSLFIISECYRRKQQIPIYFVRIERKEMKDLPEKILELRSKRQEVSPQIQASAFNVWGQLKASDRELRVYEKNKVRGEHYSYYDEQISNIVRNTDVDSFNGVVRHLLRAQSPAILYGTGFLAWRYSILFS